VIFSSWLERGRKMPAGTPAVRGGVATPGARGCVIMEGYGEENLSR